MKRNIYIITIVFVLCAFFYFYNTQRPKTIAKCPEAYTEDRADYREREIATDEWINDFRKNNPNVSLEDIARARYQFYADNNCSATLEKYFEMEPTETETEEERILRETIQEEIHKQAAKNLFQALKEDKK